MGEQQTVEPVHARPVQILTNHALIIPLVPAIEQPIRGPRPQMNGRPRADIQDRDFCKVILRPLRMIDIKMSAGNLREKLHDAENKPRENPIRIIKNDGEPRQ